MEPVMFQRKPIRDDLYKEILARICDGRLPAGHRINESRLSSDLGISRTPLREAMLVLEAQGFLGSDMGRGFLVPDLWADEFLEIQDLLAHLEPSGLASSFPIPPPRIMELQNLLRRAQQAADKDRAQRAAALTEGVYRWAQRLLADCANRMLVRDVLRLEALSRRYWYEAVVLDYDPSRLLASLEGIYELLRTDEREAAGDAWQNHIQRFARDVARHLPRRTAAT